MCGVCSALERERARYMVEAVTFVKLSGAAYIHAHEWLLLQHNMGLYGNFCSLFLLILHSMFYFSSQKLFMTSK